MADGFLGRWSKRKLDVKEGKPLGEPVVAPVATPVAVERPVVVPSAAPTVEAQAGPVAEPSLPTLDDVRSLTHHGDFKPYMAQGVAPEVKNAAMKKLFADPHFNVMDRLDTYIDDYSQPDPIPASMLRQMVGSKLLGLFDEEEKKEALARAGAGDVADAPGSETVAQSYAKPDIPGAPNNDTVTDTASPLDALPDAPASQEHDAHTDLRLQPDDAAPAQGAGRSTR